MKKTLPILLFWCTLLSMCISCSNSHFISDKTYREQVHKDFLVRQTLAEHRNKQLFAVFNQSLSLEEKEALEFLYAYMPLSDLADYDGDFFLQQVRYALKARSHFSWGETIPEDIFRHFVLVYRVNNENLDTARMFIFNELKDRIKNMSMYDAALEVNHWCHEKAAYRPSDIRTSAPLATIRTSLGRCGEESTLTVTAMRACGIPARQCYTPRWAHCDDNHAWVEVWVNGKWHFLGACEPDPELDMGWFAIPSTRTMMVHSNVFGKYNGSEEVNKQTDLYACVNMLPNYTKTKKIKITVTDEKHKPVIDATVKFKLYNYAEYYTLATQNTDQNGNAFLTTGYGDLLIWANHNNQYAYAKFDVRRSDSITLILNSPPKQTYTELFEMIPPEPSLEKKQSTKEKIERNNERLKYEDSIRTAYVSTFMTEKEASTIHNPNFRENIWPFIQKSEGNYAEIIKFINFYSDYNPNITLYDFLSTLSDKDLRDTPANILQDHVTEMPTNIDTASSNKKNAKDCIYNPFTIYKEGILPARISNELIRPWRKYLQQELPKEMGKCPSIQTVKKWIEDNIEIRNEDNYYNCPISPRGVFDLRVSDKHSRDIFFVAACRSLNIPAYLDNATNTLYAYSDSTWKPIYFETQKSDFSSKLGNLIINLPKKQEGKPEYYIHYTLAKFENGDFVSFDFENDARVAEFPISLPLEQGYYMLSTGNRYSDGTVLSRLDFFEIEAGKTTYKTLEIRELEPRNLIYGTTDLSQPLNKTETTTLQDCMTKDKTVICFIDPTREPTKHLLKDLTIHKNEFEKWGGKIILMIPSDKNTTEFSPKQWSLPKNSMISIDNNKTLINYLLQCTNQEFREEYPLIFIINNQGKIVFKNEGYRIGTAALIYKIL